MWVESLGHWTLFLNKSITQYLAPWRKIYDKPRQHIKKQRHHFADKCLSSESYGFSGSHVQMWELDHKEDWGPKNWCFLILVLEKTLESLLDSREIKPVNHKGNKSWIFIGRTDAETEALTLWPSDAKRERSHRESRKEGNMKMEAEAAVTIHSDFGAQENQVCHCFHCFPTYLPWSDGSGCHDLSFWILRGFLFFCFF